MNRLVFALLFVTVPAYSSPGASWGQAAAVVATVQLAPDVPAKLTTAFSAQAVAASGPRVVTITAPGFVPRDVIAQRDSASGRLWFLASLDKPALRGTTVQLRGRPLKTESAPAVSIRAAAGGLQVLDADRPVLFYATKPQSLDGQYVRSGFVHPLLGLDGEHLTEVMPADHRHHHGIFWAWHQLWVGDQRAGDPWVTEDFLAVVREARVVEQGPVFATLRARLHWTSPKIVDADGQPRPIVAETTTIRVFHATETAQWIDFEIQLEPLLPDVRLGGAENERGYSGFTVRVRPPRQMRIVAESGRLDRDAVGTRSRWADVTGEFGDGDRLSGVAILAHGSLPEFPPRWLLRFYGMQNVVYPGRQPIRLTSEKPLVLRHRLVIHRGDAQASRIGDQQRVYESGPPSP